jgi:hypothetical protein
MRFLAVITLCLAGSAFSSLAADEMLASSRGTFTITQHLAGNWTTKLHFTKPGTADITFTDDYPWPALFYVSPDEQWILQVQKSGSGDNISFLYRLDTNGRLWRMEQRFGELAFTYLQRSLGISIADLYHTGIEFTGWNLKAGILRFTIRGSSTKKSGKGVNQELIYDLQKHNFRAP